MAKSNQDRHNVSKTKNQKKWLLGIFFLVLIVICVSVLHLFFQSDNKTEKIQDESSQNADVGNLNAVPSATSSLSPEPVPTLTSAPVVSAPDVILTPSPAPTPTSVITATPESTVTPVATPAPSPTPVATPTPVPTPVATPVATPSSDQNTNLNVPTSADPEPETTPNTNSDTTDPNSSNFDPTHKEGYIYVPGFGYIEIPEEDPNASIEDFNGKDFWDIINDPNSEIIGH